MKTWVPVILLFSLLGSFLVACNSQTQSSNGQQTQATPNAGASPSNLADFKDLFFADQPLEEITKRVEATGPEGPNNPWTLFGSAVAASRQSKGEEARQYLKQALAIPDLESRIKLWAWKGLRELGEQPPADVADEVQGVVCELHNEAGVGTIAAYADGRARWLGGQSEITVWDAPGTNAEISALIGDLLRDSEQLVKSAPLSEKHKTPEPNLDHFRVSILTYSGVRTVEVFGPEIDESHPVATVLTGSVKLLDALAKSEQSRQ